MAPRIMRHHALALLACLTLLATPGPAALARSAMGDLGETVNPPANPGSPEEKADLLQLKAFISAQATPARLVRAKADSKRSLEVFLEGMGIRLPASATDDLHDVVKDARRSLKEANNALKGRFNRIRPFRLDQSIKVCTDKEPDSQSYPSGHAGFGTMTAELLAIAIPEKAAAFRARGLAYGESRSICGLHFLSDVAAGSTIGRLVAARLLKDADFRQELDAAATKLRAGLKL